MSIPWDRPARGRHALGAALLAVLILVGGCTSGHSALGSSSSPCFKALPVATEAVHGKGTLLGVRLLRSRDLRHLPRVQSAVGIRRLGTASVCAVAFRGRYLPGQVDHAVNNRAGPVAVVITDDTGRTVLASFVLSRLPLRFSHLI
ncbi:MAG: hypothetical protein ACRD1G_17775 [Acidimicrobiales bacterium]